MRRPATTRPTLRSEDGFTLVELLATMAVSTVVLFAVLSGADVFSRTTTAQSNTVETQEQSRQVLRTIVRDLREARNAPATGSPMVLTPSATTALGSDVIVAAYVRGGSGGSGTTGATGATGATGVAGRTPGWRRYCVSGSSLYVGQRVGDAYAEPLGCNVATTNGWTYSRLVDRRLRDGSKLFSFTADASFTANGCDVSSTTPCLPPPSAVRGVAVRLTMADTAKSDEGRTITGALSFRNRTPQ